jgi:hypothetical protein
MEWLFYSIGIILIIFFLSWISEKSIHSNRNITLHYLYGTFMKQSNNIPYIFRCSKSYIVCHEIGTSTIHDIIWYYTDVPYKYTITDTTNYAIWNQDLKNIIIYDENNIEIDNYILLDKCPLFTNIIPTPSTINEDYEFVIVNESEYDEFSKLLIDKRHCVSINDWYLYTGQNINFLCNNIFVMDKKKTCFFILPIELKEIYLPDDIHPREALVFEFKDLLFAGVLSGSN